MKMPGRTVLVVALSAAFAFAASANDEVARDEVKDTRATTASAPAAPLDDGMEEAASAGEERITDAKFFERAASGNMLEVELGKLAQDKAVNAEIKAFAQRMVTDHSAKIEELKALAAKKNVALPTELAPQHQAVCDRLEKLQGQEFDEGYADYMVRAHREMEHLLLKTAEQTQDADIRSFANETLEGVKAHYAHAQKIDALEVTAGIEEDVVDDEDE